MTRAEGQADRWLEHSRRKLAGVDLAASAETLGRVTHIADGIARVSGLPDVRLNELLHFEGGETGLALALDADSISAVLLDDVAGVEASARVSGSGEVVRVPVGPSLLGRKIGRAHV